MRQKTRAFTSTVILGTVAVELLKPNPRRKSFILSPVVAGIAPTVPVVAAVFGVGAAQPWVVPAGVTQLVDAFAWGSGGDAGVQGAMLGGGGGGGGGFAASGPVTVIPATTLTVTVDGHGLGLESKVALPGSFNICRSSSGTSGLLDAAGAPGVGTVGPVVFAGGVGDAATALAGAGAGGGGAGGAYHAGFAAAGQVAGPGGGGAVLLGYGTGGTGGVGGNAAAGGNDGGGPGAGGGGAGSLGTPEGFGANGQAVIFYVPANSIGYVSVSREKDVTAGNGVINYITGATFPTIITDEEVGDCIGEPWYAVASTAGQVVQVVEFFDLDSEPAF